MVRHISKVGVIYSISFYLLQLLHILLVDSLYCPCHLIPFTNKYGLSNYYDLKLRNFFVVIFVLFQDILLCIGNWSTQAFNSHGEIREASTELDYWAQNWNLCFAMCFLECNVKPVSYSSQYNFTKRFTVSCVDGDVILLCFTGCGSIQ